MTISLDATQLAPGDTYVLADDGHTLYTSPGPDQVFTESSWNGNDVVRRLTQASRSFFERPPDGFAPHPLVFDRLVQ